MRYRVSGWIEIANLAYCTLHPIIIIFISIVSKSSSYFVLCVSRVNVWAVLVKAARGHEVWDVCRAACRFCLLYDDGRWTESRSWKSWERDPEGFLISCPVWPAWQKTIFFPVKKQTTLKLIILTLDINRFNVEIMVCVLGRMLITCVIECCLEKVLINCIYSYYFIIIILF